jgi:hypothetical protein
MSIVYTYFMNTRLLVYIFIVAISFLCDKIHSECKDPTFFKDGVSLVHHFISIYLWFGTFIFGYPEYHLLFILAIKFGWVYFGSCVISEWYNNACKLSKRENHKDIPYYVVSTITNKKYQSYDNLVYVIIGIDVVYLAMKYKLLSF